MAWRYKQEKAGQDMPTTGSSFTSQKNSFENKTKGGGFLGLFKRKVTKIDSMPNDNLEEIEGDTRSICNFIKLNDYIKEYY